MKRLLAFVLCCFVLLSFAACGASDKATDDDALRVDNLGDTMRYTITKVYTSWQLMPENTENFHKYYEASDGNTLFIVEMDVTNISEDIYRIWLLGEAKLTIDQTDYEANIAVKLDGQDNAFGNGNIEINSNETYHVYYMFDIPAEAAEEEAVFSITSNGQTQSHDVKAA